VAKVGEYMRAGDADPDIRVIVLTGVRRGFCSGANLGSRASAGGLNRIIGGAGLGLRGIPQRKSGSHRTRCWRRQSRANPSLNAEFPASREFTGNFIDSGPPARQQQPKKGIKTKRYEPIPYASEQGICFDSARN